MKKIKILGLIACFAILLSSCDNQTDGKDDTNVQLDPHNSINIEIKVSHLDSFDVMSTSKTVHDNFGKIVKTIVTFDTLPKLGLIKDTLDTGRTYVDADGYEQEKDTIITHPKDYQLYISVKK